METFDIHLLSIIIPVFNEEDNLELLHQQLIDTLSSINVNYEIIYVDDGSVDQSFEKILQIADKYEKHVKGIQLSRNYGQTAAISAGIDYALGDAIVLMDADLQNDPADIPMIIEKLREGHELVSGWRVNRQDPWLTRRVPSKIANYLISKITGVHLHDYGCTLKAYHRKVLNGFRLYGEMHRFLPAYAAQVGARIVEVPVNHHPRRFGKSKYGLDRTFKVILDLLTVKFFNSYAGKPIYLFGSVGVASVVISMILLVYLVSSKLMLHEPLIQSPLLFLTVMLFIMGFQSIFMGLMTELLMRTYHESQGKRTYSIRRIIDEKEIE
jgi:glycosyltransferase involved in cell wall biosynthesis